MPLYDCCIICVALVHFSTLSLYLLSCPVCLRVMLLLLLGYFCIMLSSRSCEMNVFHLLPIHWKKMLLCRPVLDGWNRLIWPLILDEIYWMTTIKQQNDLGRLVSVFLISSNWAVFLKISNILQLATLIPIFLQKKHKYHGVAWCTWMTPITFGKKEYC